MSIVPHPSKCIRDDLADDVIQLHQWVEQNRHCNPDRVRTFDKCAHCGCLRYGCYAFRLDEERAGGPNL